MPAMSGSGRQRYALATAAYNEEKYVAALIKSVIAQKHRPALWIIVSDGSTDGTDEIVTKYAHDHEFIRHHRVAGDHPRNFAAQVRAINSGLTQVQRMDVEFIGNLDADITLDPNYFESLLAKFGREPRLGLGGGYIYEEFNGEFKPRRANTPRSVAHAIQLFRIQCLEDIGGGYEPLPYGGPDWYAEIKARMQNWDVKAFPELKVYHHRPTSSAEGFPRNWYRQGLLHYSFGTYPVFEVCKALRRVPCTPYVLGAAVMLSAFLWAHVRQEKRCVPPEMVEYLRKEQIARVASFFSLGHWRKGPLGSATGL